MSEEPLYQHSLPSFLSDREFGTVVAGSVVEDIISQKVLIKSFYQSQFPHISVKLFL